MKFSEYLPQHAEVYPRPIKKLPALGWEFWISVFVAVAAIVLAALRTAHTFFLAAQLSTQVYGLENGFLVNAISLTEAAAAMVAIEGGIVYGAVKRAKHHAKVNGRVFLVYLGLLVLISMVAGLGQSLSLVVGLPEAVQVYFSWFMAIILGTGASIVAWLSGEMLGVELVKFEQAQANADATFQRMSTRWLNGARQAWKDAQKQPGPNIIVTPRIETQDKAARRIQAFIDRVTLTENRMPAVEEISSATGLGPEYVNGVLQMMRKEL